MKQFSILVNQAKLIEPFLIAKQILYNDGIKAFQDIFLFRNKLQALF